MMCIFSASIYLGSLYVNDFDKYGKTYRVYIQADQNFRENKTSISNYFVQNFKGENVPLSTIVEIKQVSGVSTITILIHIKVLL